jgi:hypothetical protein
VVETIDADLVIPVHTFRPEFFKEMDRKVVLPTPGISIEIP